MRKLSRPSDSEAISMIKLADMFPDELTARNWFESLVWPDGRYCPHCNNTKTKEHGNPSCAPYWCGACRSYFSAKTGTAIAKSKVPYRKWAFAIYICATNIKGVSSTKLHTDLNVTQKTAWFMLHRIKEAWITKKPERLDRPMQVDEKNKVGNDRKGPRRKKLRTRGEAVSKKSTSISKGGKSGKTVENVKPNNTSGAIKCFVENNANDSSRFYKDAGKEHRSVARLQEANKRRRGKLVRVHAHTNETAWLLSMLNWVDIETCHQISPKHIDRLIPELARRFNLWTRKTIRQMQDIVFCGVGSNLIFPEHTQ